MAMQDTAAQGNGADSGARAGDGQDFDEIKDTALRSARGLSTELKREGQRLMKDAGESAVSLANEKKTVAADYLRAVADAANASCQVLEQRGYAGSSRFLNHAVRSIGEFTDNLATREPNELLDEAVSYARRNPVVFLGAALFAGFGLARLFEASAAAQDDLGEDEDTDENQDFHETMDDGGGEMDDAGAVEETIDAP
ncbi:MAG: hypothetical protein AB7E79_08495 [Rhodospirillaceae bacterium]